MSDLKIRRATVEDTKIVLEFIKKFAKYEKLSRQVTATEEDIKLFIFERSHARILLFEIDQEPVGFCVYFYTVSTFLAKPTLHLEDLFFVKKHRGKGYGKEVLAFLANHALKNNCARFEWGCPDWNKATIRYYENMGAENLKEWVDFRLEGKKLTELAANSQHEI